MSAAPEMLAERLGHRFADPGLLEQALTHRSAGGASNERLEFLGDSVLGLVIAEALFQRCPDYPEGDLSRLRASLVRGDTLARLAAEIDLGKYLRLGSGELKSGGFRRKSILADALEAVLGAVYLDGGLEAATAVIERLYADRLTDLPSAEQLKDAKTRLQEYLQSRRREVPEYRVVDVSGKDHAQCFRVSCRVPGVEITATGEGGSRRGAEQAAAQAMLERLVDDG